MKHSEVSELLRSREAVARARLRENGRDLVFRVAGGEQEERGPGEERLAAYVPLGIAAGLGFLLAPRRPRCEAHRTARRLVSAGWLMGLARTMSVVSGLARGFGPGSHADDAPEHLQGL